MPRTLPYCSVLHLTSCSRALTYVYELPNMELCARGRRYGRVSKQQPDAWQQRLQLPSPGTLALSPLPAAHPLPCLSRCHGLYAFYGTLPTPLLTGRPRRTHTFSSPTYSPVPQSSHANPRTFRLTGRWANAAWNSCGRLCPQCQIVERTRSHRHAALCCINASSCATGIS